MKKHRGLKRYYKGLAVYSEFDNMPWLDFDNPQTWLDNWHLHFDTKGYGNNSFKKRKPHLDKLFRHFGLLVSLSKSLQTDFKLYAIILDFHSASDALFFEPSPNKNKFQFKLSDLTTKSNLTNKALDNYIKNLSGFKIRYGHADENFCLICDDVVGCV